jgi:hypothetical protein
MTAEYAGDPASGYFNCWSGRHPLGAVRTLDLYMKWRDGEELPPLAALPQLRKVVVPVDLVTDALVDEIAGTPVTSLEVIMGQGVVPACLFRLDQLVELDLSGLHLEEVPLGLGGNELAELPEAVGALVKLTTLEVGRNRLTALPAALHRLPHLTTLDVSCNELGTAALSELPRVAKLVANAQIRR